MDWIKKIELVKTFKIPEEQIMSDKETQENIKSEKEKISLMLDLWKEKN